MFSFQITTQNKTNSHSRPVAERGPEVAPRDASDWMHVRGTRAVAVRVEYRAADVLFLGHFLALSLALVE